VDQTTTYNNLKEKLEMKLNIDSKQQIAGFPAVRVRSALRAMGADLVATPLVAEILEIGHAEARTLMDELGHLGYVTKVPREELLELVPSATVNSADCWYQATELGQFFAKMSLAARIKQATAEEAVVGFLQRLKEVNADDNFAYRIVAAVAFGGFPSATEDRVSVRIAIDLELRDQAILGGMLRAKFHKLLATGDVSGFFDQTSFPRAGIWEFLRNGKWTVDLHHFLTLERLAREIPVQYRVVFGDKTTIQERLGPLATEV
jgi:hypothetical protein